MAVCKFLEERVNKVHKQPATSANLQDYGVKSHVHQDTRVINCRAAHSGQRSRGWHPPKTMGKMQKGRPYAKGPWQMPQFLSRAPEASA